MSFIIGDDERMLRDAWPSRIGRPIGDVSTATSLPERRCVHNDFESICSWASVLRLPNVPADELCKHILAYNTGSAEEAEEPPAQVVIRVQGFLKAFNLTPLGNWRGADRDAPRAVQFVDLESRGFDDAFEPQKQFLETVRAMVLGTLSNNQESFDAHMDTHAVVHLERRVFSRVRATGVRSGGSVLRPSDDLYGRAAKISSRWIVAHRLKIGVQRDDGRIVACSPIVLRKGDFVDIAVSVDIATVREGRRARNTVQFAIQEVVRLHSAADLSEIGVRSETGTDVGAGFTTMASGFGFGEVDGVDGEMRA